VRETLSLLGRVHPITVHEVPSGTVCFDWTIPDEWNVRDAYIEDETGSRILDFRDSNLHVMGYSVPVDRALALEELLPHLYVSEERPDAIPYVTSYYKRRWGFCLPETRRNALKPGRYHVKIDSTLEPGFLTYGEILLTGREEREIILSTYICHPSMANNELSGPCLGIYLAKMLSGMNRRYTYRIVFLPETIGSITYISRNLEHLRDRLDAGFVLSCVGDDRAYSMVASRYGDTLADRALKNVLSHDHPEYLHYSFLQRGSDERQYCAPGVGLPVCGFCRSKYGEYPEYHTSDDDLSLISPSGLQGAYDVMRSCILALEHNRRYRVRTLCEPQLGRRGLYPTVSYQGSAASTQAMMNFIAYADGTDDLIGISDRIGVPVRSLIPIVAKLSDAGLLET
jgi:aminopeptidase-like protein